MDCYSSLSVRERRDHIRIRRITINKYLRKLPIALVFVFAANTHTHVQAKVDYDSGMVWGESEILRGRSATLEPCAKPGCSPFPTCCRTDDLIDHMTPQQRI